MEKIQIKPINKNVSRVCLGTWAIGGWLWGGAEDEESIETIHTALENGINIIDTAPVYGFGHAEKIVGDAIKRYGKRDDLIIATKVGLNWQGEKVFRDSSMKRIKAEINQSLKRLQTDYIDIYQIHWPDSKIPIAETAEAMLALFNEGKIKAIGVSNFSTQQMTEFMQYAPIHTSQPPYNLFERGIEQTILPFTEINQIATLAYGALCRGLLSGRMTPSTIFNGDDIRLHDPKFKMPCYAEYLGAVDELQKFAHQEYSKSIVALAVRWVLDRGHTIALWGARHPKQLAAISEIDGWNLDAEAMQKIDRILEKSIMHPLSPEFMAPP